MSAGQSQITLRETDVSSSRPCKTYVLSTSTTSEGTSSSRLDDVTTQDSRPHSHSQSDSDPERKQRDSGSDQHLTYIPAFFSPYIFTTITYLKVLFLPTGYPDSVTEDYTPYQIYDSIQAFASTIASLLSSRAVLQSLNIISSTSTSSSGSDFTSTSQITPSSTEAATAATLLSILQSTLSNLTTILFASHAAPRISPDVKFYRFLADVVNDLAFVLDLLAPSLPTSFNVILRDTYFPATVTVLTSRIRLPFTTPFSFFTPRVLALCTSSMLRAICGVAGGSSKAVLSAHFARSNPENVGELNAKDGSQETIINLMGMWVGGVVVSRVDGVLTTWIWMLGLLAVHLWANYCAVRSVRLRGLNRERTGMVVKEILREDGRGEKWVGRAGFHGIGARESVLGVRSGIGRVWRRVKGRSIEDDEDWRRWRVGASVEEFVSAACCSDKSSSRRTSGSMVFDDHEVNAAALQLLLLGFQKEVYILWIDLQSGRITIALRTGAVPRDHLRACLHASLVLKRCRQENLAKVPYEFVKKILIIRKEVIGRWDEWCEGLTRAGWDLDSIHLEDGTGTRLDFD